MMQRTLSLMMYVEEVSLWDLRGEEELELVLALAVHEARAQPQQPLLR